MRRLIRNLWIIVVLSGAWARPASSSDYVDIVEMYQRREVGPAMKQLRRLSPERLTQMLEQWEDAGFRPGDDRLQAAAVMHTELAMSLVDEIKLSSAAFHVGHAGRLIDNIRNAAQRERFRRDWLLAVACFYQASGFTLGVSVAFEWARGYFDEAVGKFPRDAEIFLAAGAFYEWSGSLTYGDKGHLKKAQRLYQRSIEASPKVAEAHLRYGRVLEKRGELEQAKAPLQRASELTPSAFVNYMASLILGRVAERQGDLSKAIDYYRKATETLPNWQVAYVALSHALEMDGRGEASARVLSKAIQLHPRTSEELDGWIVYELGRARQGDELWRKLREEVMH